MYPTLRLVLLCLAGGLGFSMGSLAQVIGPVQPSVAWIDENVDDTYEMPTGHPMHMILTYAKDTTPLAASSKNCARCHFNQASPKEKPTPGHPLDLAPPDSLLPLPPRAAPIVCLDCHRRLDLTRSWTRPEPESIRCDSCHGTVLPAITWQFACRQGEVRRNAELFGLEYLKPGRDPGVGHPGDKLWTKFREFYEDTSECRLL